MALDADDTDLLFTEIGKALFAANTNNTATKTTGTIAAEIEDFTKEVGASDASGAAGDPSFRSAAILDAVSGAQKAVAPLLSSGQSVNTTAVQTPVQNLVVQVVKADSQQPNDSSLAAIIELTRQMLVMSPVETLAANEPDVSSVDYGPDFDGTSATSDNTGDGILNASDKRGDGRVNEHLLPEVIEGTITSVTPTGQASFQLKGELSVSKMSPDWPGGSGVTSTLTSYVAASGANLVNGTFEISDTNEADLPAGWISAVGIANIGTTLILTPVEVQTIDVNSTTGNPTSGYYVVTFVDKDSNEQDTVPLVFNASGSALQSALRNLNGLGEVTVSTTGDTPDFLHTITFTGVTNPGALTVSNQTDSGDFDVAVSPEASANVMRGARAVHFVGIGAPELTSIVHPVVLSPATVYAMSIWVMSDDVPATGEMKIDLVDSVGSPTVVADDQSTDNTVTIDITAIDGTYTQYTAFFRTPTVMPDTIYLRVHMTTAIADTDDVFIDELVLVPANELYPGGPFAAIFTGPTDWVDTDVLRFSPANLQIGLIHTWMDRIFDLSNNRLLLSSTTETETILDSLIS